MESSYVPCPAIVNTGISAILITQITAILITKIKGNPRKIGCFLIQTHAAVTI
jgi:hypothetical protein